MLRHQSEGATLKVKGAGGDSEPLLPSRSPSAWFLPSCCGLRRGAWGLATDLELTPCHAKRSIYTHARCGRQGTEPDRFGHFVSNPEPTPLNWACKGSSFWSLKTHDMQGSNGEGGSVIAAHGEEARGDVVRVTVNLEL